MITVIFSVIELDRRAFGYSAGISRRNGAETVAGAVYPRVLGCRRRVVATSHEIIATRSSPRNHRHDRLADRYSIRAARSSLRYQQCTVGDAISSSGDALKRRTAFTLRFLAF
jgi:hypothetical protein